MPPDSLQQTLPARQKVPGIPAEHINKGPITDFYITILGKFRRKRVKIAVVHFAWAQDQAITDAVTQRTGAVKMTGAVQLVPTGRSLHVVLRVVQRVLGITAVGKIVNPGIDVIL